MQESNDKIFHQLPNGTFSLDRDIKLLFLGIGLVVILYNITRRLDEHTD